MFLAVLLVTALLYYAAKDARTDQELARQGIVSPRLLAKYGPDAAARVQRYRYLDYLADAWSDRWQQRTATRRAMATATPATPGERVTWRDRWIAAGDAMSRAATAVRDSPVVRRVVDPVGERAPVADAPPESASGPADIPDAVPPGTVRFTNNGREQWTGTEWVPVADPDAPVETATVKDTVALPKIAPEEQPMTTVTPAAPATGSAPSGEATGVAGGAGQARAIRIAALALRETTVAKLKELAAAAETLEASGAGMEIDPATMAEIARAREAIAALMAALMGAAEEVDGSMTAVEKEFNKHLPGVDFNASVGGMAKKGAYDGN